MSRAGLCVPGFDPCEQYFNRKDVCLRNVTKMTYANVSQRAPVLIDIDSTNNCLVIGGPCQGQRRRSEVVYGNGFDTKLLGFENNGTGSTIPLANKVLTDQYAFKPYFTWTPSCSEVVTFTGRIDVSNVFGGDFYQFLVKVNGSPIYYDNPIGPPVVTTYGSNLYYPFMFAVLITGARIRVQNQVAIEFWNRTAARGTATMRHVLVDRALYWSDSALGQ